MVRPEKLLSHDQSPLLVCFRSRIMSLGLGFSRGGIHPAPVPLLLVQVGEPVQGFGHAEMFPPQMFFQDGYGSLHERLGFRSAAFQPVKARQIVQAVYYIQVVGAKELFSRGQSPPVHSLAQHIFSLRLVEHPQII